MFCQKYSYLGFEVVLLLFLTFDFSSFCSFLFFSSSSKDFIFFCSSFFFISGPYLLPNSKTAKSRKTIASLADNGFRSKTTLDGLGKNLVAGLKKKTGAIAKERKKMRDYLDQLKAKTRKPLTDFEESENSLTENMYFVVGSKLMDELMVGEFSDSVIIIGGCESTRNHDLPKSLLERGASVVVGWDRSINSLENDRVMLELLEETLVNKIGIHDGINTVMEKHRPNLEFSSELNYFQHGR